MSLTALHSVTPWCLEAVHVSHSSPDPVSWVLSGSFQPPEILMKSVWGVSHTSGLLSSPSDSNVRPGWKIAGISSKVRCRQRQSSGSEMKKSHVLRHQGPDDFSRLPRLRATALVPRPPNPPFTLPLKCQSLNSKWITFGPLFKIPSRTFHCHWENSLTCYARLLWCVI